MATTWTNVLDGATQSITSAADAAAAAAAAAASATDAAASAASAASAAQSAAATVTATGATTARTLPARFGDALSVKDFGAVGDGVTDDYAKVQAALTAAGAMSGGACVEIGPGVYSINGGTLAVPGNVAIVGRGGTLKHSANVALPLLSINGVSGVSIRNVKFNCTGANLVGSCIKIENATDTEITGNRFVGGLAIECKQGAVRLRVENNDFTDGRSCLAAGTVNTGTEADSTDIAFIGNTARNMTDEGIDLNFNVRRATITGNTFYNCSQFGQPGAGEVIDIGGMVHEDIVVSGNSIDLASQQVNGITVKINDPGSTGLSVSRRVTISGNAISNGNPAGGSGIYLTHPDRVSVTGNTIEGTLTGIYLQTTATEVIVTGNIIRTQAQAVVLASGTKASLHDNHLQTVGTTTACVEVQNGFSLWSIEGNRIIGGTRCIVTNSGGSPGIISGNECTGSNSYGIFCVTPKTVISGNRVTGNGVIAVCVQAADCVVTGNVIYDNATVTAGSYGLQLNAGSDGAVITGNRITGTSQGGFRVAAAIDRVIFANNQVFGNAGGNTNGTGNLTNSVNVNNIVA